jgi:hypothetical protein
MVNWKARLRSAATWLSIGCALVLFNGIYYWLTGSRASLFYLFGMAGAFMVFYAVGILLLGGRGGKNYHCSKCGTYLSGRNVPDPGAQTAICPHCGVRLKRKGWFH